MALVKRCSREQLSESQAEGMSLASYISAAIDHVVQQYNRLLTNIGKVSELCAVSAPHLTRHGGKQSTYSSKE